MQGFCKQPELKMGLKAEESSAVAQLQDWNTQDRKEKKNLDYTRLCPWAGLLFLNMQPIPVQLWMYLFYLFFKKVVMCSNRTARYLMYTFLTPSLLMEAS